MDSVFNKNLLNPLAPVSGKNHCDVLFIVLILSLIVVIFTLVGVIGSFCSTTKGLTIGSLVLLLQVVLVHHVYRIIYTMCLNTI